MRKYLRNYKLKAEIGTMNNGLFIVTETVLIEYPLTINFSITRSEFAQACTASIELINLQESTRAKLYKDRNDFKKHIVVSLYAGYGEDSNKLPLCFCGDVYECYSYKEGGTTEYKTEISTMSGCFSRTQFSSNFEMAAGTPPLLIIQKLASDMHIELATVSTSILNKIQPASRATPFSGTSYDLLSNYVNGHLFIDNNKLYILDTDDFRKDTLITVDADSGLIGTPKRRDSILEATMVFEPNLELCQLMLLTSITAPYLNGTYKVVGFSHNGTISGAVGGACTSSAYLYVGSSVFNPLSLL